jgi:hypothetical protein
MKQGVRTDAACIPAALSQKTPPTSNSIVKWFESMGRTVSSPNCEIMGET